jgi:molybdopterin synthase sulfur carrier subunit
VVALQLAYFAWVRERMGCGEEQVEPPASVATASDLIAWLAARDDRGARAFAEPARIRVAIDGQMMGNDAALAGARDVALFPPVTGG